LPAELLTLWSALYGVLTASWFPYVMGGGAALLLAWQQRERIVSAAKRAFDLVRGQRSKVGFTFNPLYLLVILGIGSLLLQHDWQPGPDPPPGPAPVVTPDTPAPAPVVTAVAYVYEKDQTAPPVGVQTGLNRLNREKKIVATLFEEDTVDGNGETPDQYKAALAAAREAGLPSLVVSNGSVVLKVVKAPTTEEHVLGAIQ
jgi:hypothetical protein